MHLSINFVQTLALVIFDTLFECNETWAPLDYIKPVV